MAVLDDWLMIKLLIMVCERDKRSVARVQLAGLGEMVVVGPVQARVAER
jgi:hypothetical protein